MRLLQTHGCYVAILSAAFPRMFIVCTDFKLSACVSTFIQDSEQFSRNHTREKNMTKKDERKRGEKVKRHGGHDKRFLFLDIKSTT